MTTLYSRKSQNTAAISKTRPLLLEAPGVLCAWGRGSDYNYINKYFHSILMLSAPNVQPQQPGSFIKTNLRWFCAMSSQLRASRFSTQLADSGDIYEVPDSPPPGMDPTTYTHRWLLEEARRPKLTSRRKRRRRTTKGITEARPLLHPSPAGRRVHGTATTNYASPLTRARPKTDAQRQRALARANAATVRLEKRIPALSPADEEGGDWQQRRIAEWVADQAHGVVVPGPTSTAPRREVGGATADSREPDTTTATTNRCASGEIDADCYCNSATARSFQNQETTGMTMSGTLSGAAEAAYRPPAEIRSKISLRSRDVEEGEERQSAAVDAAEKGGQVGDQAERIVALPGWGLPKKGCDMM